MPPRRRATGGRAKTKSKTPPAQIKESSSAEDSEGNAAREIVKRLARKYLLKSSTDTTDSSDHKENMNARGQVTDPYDADLETDGGVTTTSDMECQTDESSIMDDSLVLSPSRKTNKQNTGKGARRKRGQQQTSASQKTRQKAKPIISYQKQKNTSKRKSDADQASRGSQTDSEECEPQSTKKTKVQSLQETDSGMFVSPIRPLPKLLRMNASDTSTPASSVMGKSLDDSCFGFDHITSPQGLPFSPVESMSPPDDGIRPGSAMSGMSSLHSSISSATSSILSPPKRKYDTVNLTGLIPGDNDQSGMPAAKKTKKKKMPVKKNDDEWASKMSAEFDDIDMYELTIE